MDRADLVPCRLADRVAGGGPARFRFKSMPTMPEDEDAEVKQVSYTRAEPGTRVHGFYPELTVPN